MMDLLLAWFCASMFIMPAVLLTMWLENTKSGAAVSAWIEDLLGLED